MLDLTTTFAGLKLNNPIIISSSGLTKSAENNANLAAAGAGAVVLKSLFEEQILHETSQLLDDNAFGRAEGYDYLTSYVRQHKLEDYLNVVRDSKKNCNIPVIASISCYNDSEWVNFAKDIERAGADAIEINILSLQTQRAINYEYGSFEKEHVNILKHLKQTINIPIIMKLGNNFTNPIALVDQLKQNGADAVVLFNRFFPLDVDIDNKKTVAGQILSSGFELSNSLRWTGFAYSRLNPINIAVSGGVRDADGLVKSILVGASAVELCSVIFEKGPQYINVMKENLSAWMEKHHYTSISQFKGLLHSDSEGDDTDLFERTQFIKYFGSKE